MNTVLRVFVNLLIFGTGFFCVYLVSVTALSSTGEWVVYLLSFLLASVIVYFTWKGTSGMKSGMVLLSYPLRGALLLGGISFVGGFFGPLIFNPSATLGPLVGILIIGLAGFFLGLIAGTIYERMKPKNK